ncbi:MAG: hypothetical protein MJ196_06185 [Treponemataceae bacterium]|nr:hypothetical protein [Treponemataceae bacterium]
MGRKKAFPKKLVLEAILNSNGIVSTVAQKLNCDWHTADTYIHKWEETIQAYNNETEKVLDFAENKIMESIRKGNTADAKWYLSKKGKHRGFGDDNQLDLFNKTAPDDNEIRIIIDDDTQQ